MTETLTLPDRLTTEEAARYLGLATQTLALWRTVGRGPAFIRMGRSIRYDRAALDAFLASNTVACAVEAR